MQSINIHVKPGFKQQKIEKHIDIYCNELIHHLATRKTFRRTSKSRPTGTIVRFFSIPKSKITIAKGATSTYKRIILDV